MLMKIKEIMDIEAIEFFAGTVFLKGHCNILSNLFKGRCLNRIGIKISGKRFVMVSSI